MKKFLFFLILIVFFIDLLNIFSDQPWFFYYKLGLDKIKEKQFEAALLAFNKAIELNPLSSSHARTYGMNFIEYYPYLGAAICQYYLGNYEASKNSLEKELSNGAINESQDMLNKAYWLKGKLEEIQQKNKKQVNNIPPVNLPKKQEPLPIDMEKQKPPIEKLENKLGEHRKIGRDIKLLRDSISAYLDGDYTQSIIKLGEISLDAPPPIASLKNFILGCSHASLYYLEGESNEEELKLAKYYFKRVDKIPKQFEMKFLKYISPRIIALFNERDEEY